MSEAASTSLPVQENGSPTAQVPVVKCTNFTVEQAAMSGGKLTYAEVGTPCCVVLARRPAKGLIARVDLSAPLLTKNRISQEGKRGRDVKSPHRTHREAKSAKGEDVTVVTTADWYSVANPAAPHTPSGSLKRTAKNTGLGRHPLHRRKQHEGAPLPEQPVTWSGQRATRLAPWQATK